MLKQRAATPTSAAKPPRLVRNYGRIILVSLLALSILIAGGQYALYRSEQDWGAVTPDTMTLTTTERFLALPASPAHTETRTAPSIGQTTADTPSGDTTTPCTARPTISPLP